MPQFSNNFSRCHTAVAVGLLAFFTGLMFLLLVLSWGAHFGLGVAVRGVLGTVCGPFAGTIARPGDGAAWSVVRLFLPISGPLLLIGTGCQFVPLPFRRGAPAFRMTMWIVGLIAWLAPSLLSVLNAID